MEREFTRRLLKYLNTKNLGTHILEPKLIFNKAIIGYHPSSDRLIYSFKSLMDIYKSQMLDLDENEIVDYIYYNLCFGVRTPIIYDDRYLNDESEDSFYDLEEGEVITQFLGIHHIEELRFSKAEYIVGRIPNCS